MAAHNDQSRFFEEAGFFEAAQGEAEFLLGCPMLPEGWLVGDKELAAELHRFFQVVDSRHPAHGHCFHLAGWISGFDSVYCFFPVHPR